MRKKLPIFYSALMLTGVNLLLRFVSTSFQVFISGRIGAAGVGLLQLVMSVGMLAMTAGMAGIRTASMYLTAEELGKRKPGNVVWVLSGCFGYSIISSSIVSISMFLGAPFLAQHWVGDIQTTQSIRLFACFVPVSCLCGVMTGYFTAANRIGTLAGVEIAEQLCSMAVTMLALQLWAGSDPSRACQSIIFGSGVSSIFTVTTLVVLRIREKTPPSAPIPIRSRLLHTAVPLAVGDLTKTGINTLENLMVPKRLALYPGAAEPLAAFGTVCGMVFPILMFPAAILFALAELLIPELARCAASNSHKRIHYLVKRGLRLALLYGSIFCGLMVCFSHDLCMRLYSSSEAGNYLKRYAFLIPILYCDAITDAMTKGLGQQKACVRYNIITSAMDVVLLFIMLPIWGMEGYLISFTITHVLNFALSLRRLVWISKVRIPIQIPLFCAISITAAMHISAFLPTPTAQAFGYIVILLCLLYLMKVISKEDILWVKGLIKK